MVVVALEPSTVGTVAAARLAEAAMGKPTRQ
jgi:hypothetical protein